MPTNQWARHSDAIEDARDERNTVLVCRAIYWAISTEQPGSTELYSALAAVFYSQGNCNADACETNRATEVIIDAYLEEQQRRAAA